MIVVLYEDSWIAACSVSTVQAAQPCLKMQLGVKEWRGVHGLSPSNLLTPTLSNT